jgi:hypothetical protein
MDTQNPSRTAGRTIDLTDDERSLLSYTSGLDVSTVGELVTASSSAGELTAAIGRAEFLLTMMRAAESGRLSVDGQVEMYLREYRVSTLEVISSDQHTLERVRAGVASSCYIGMTFEESERACLAQIDRELDLLNACNSLLDRMGAF